jgi:hypothetical protein
VSDPVNDPMNDPMNDPILERWTEFLRRIDSMEQRLGELERLLHRMCELNRAIATGVPPPPPPSVN